MGIFNLVSSLFKISFFTALFRQISGTATTATMRRTVDYSSLRGFSATLARFATEGTIPGRTPEGHEFATFAGGCFWGIQLHMDRVPGVLETSVGYTQGRIERPSYEEVCSGRSGHTEALMVLYDPREVSYKALINAVLEKVDPTQENGQGYDIGTQYRSGIYYFTPEQQAIAVEVLGKEGQRRHPQRIHMEIEAARVFWPAEEYHQKYLEKGGRYGAAQSAAKGCSDPIRCYG